MNYTLDYFINKYEIIPEEMWCVGTQLNSKGQRCAFGHCNIKGFEGEEYQALKALSKLAVSILELTAYDHISGGLKWGNAGIAGINNGYYKEYQQPTPKQRVLAALYDIKKKQQPEVKERIVYVTVDQEVRELQKAELKEN